MAEANKTEKASPQRRKKAREQGQIARSRELPATLALFGVAGTTTCLRLYPILAYLFRLRLSLGPHPFDPFSDTHFLSHPLTLHVVTRTFPSIVLAKWK